MKIFIKNDLTMARELDGVIYNEYDSVSDCDLFEETEEGEYEVEVDDYDVEDCKMTLVLYIAGIEGALRISCEEEISGIEDDYGINIYDYFYGEEEY
jgi:hypothetical protein